MLINTYTICKMKKINQLVVGSMLSLCLLLPSHVTAQAPPVENPQDGSIGMQGTIPSDPPSVAATITTPTNGQGFNQLPVTVSGLCPNGLLVKLFKNNVFSGSANCVNGSYSIQTDLFSGQNDLVAIVFDSLDQAGPPSNTVTVTYNDAVPGSASRPTLTSNFAKRGANPGQALTWPIILANGVGPYAVSVDWGDGTEPDLLSQAFPGTFEISHTYASPGVYNIIVKVTDANGASAFLQLVGVGNGALAQTDGNPESEGPAGLAGTTQTTILWQPAALLLPFIMTTFWLGKKYELKMLRHKIEQGERPF